MKKIIIEISMKDLDSESIDRYRQAITNMIDKMRHVSAIFSDIKEE